MTTALIKRGTKSNLGINSFYRFHIALGIVIPLISGAIFYASNSSEVSYINSLFMTASSLTTTGLNTIILSPLTTFQQVWLMLLWLFGNPITVSWVMLVVRRFSFGRALRKLDQQRSKRQEDAEANAEDSQSDEYQMSDATPTEGNDVRKIQQSSQVLMRSPTVSAHDRGSWPNPASFLVRLGHTHLKQRLSGKQKEKDNKLFDINEVVGEQSQFKGASVEEHERLTRQEMGAMNILIVAIALYWLSARECVRVEACASLILELQNFSSLLSSHHTTQRLPDTIRTFKDSARPGSPFSPCRHFSITSVCLLQTTPLRTSTRAISCWCRAYF